jgi:hypothetical protein
MEFAPGPEDAFSAYFGYAVVDDAVVWGAASQRVPELLAVVGQLLAD